MGRLIKYDLRIDWDFSGSYTDESERLISASGGLRLSAPASGISSPRGIVDACTLVLDNRDGRYSSLKGGVGGVSAYHAPMYLQVSVDGGSTYHRVFTGVIKVPVEIGPTHREGASVTIDCRSVDETLLTKRMSTLRSHFVAAHEQGYTEADHMNLWLSAAGLSSPTHYILDDGLFVLPWGGLDDESPLEEMWSLAAACGGRVYTGPDGVIRYENAQHWLTAPHDTSQATFTPSDYERIEPFFDDAELYSGVTVETSERGFAPRGVLWEADAVETVRANSTKTITAKLRQPAYTIDAVNFTAVSGGGSNLDANVSVVATEYAQRVELVFTNSHPTLDVNLVALTLVGVAVDGRPSQEETFTSSAAYWSNRQGRTKSLRQNAYGQTTAQSQALVEVRRDRFEQPRLSFRLTGVPGDPSRLLGDRVTINDPAIMSAAHDAIVTEIQWTLGNGGFRQDLVAVDAADLYPTDNYFVIGTNKVGDSEVTFY